jgi:hypothetical protein
MVKMIVVKSCKDCPYVKPPAWDDQKHHLCGHPQRAGVKLADVYGIHDRCPLDDK